MPFPYGIPCTGFCCVQAADIGSFAIAIPSYVQARRRRAERMSHMGNYKIVTTITEMGPYVSKLILQMPYEVHAAEVSKDSFNI